MKCIYCNTELKQGAKFCPNCGKEVIEFNQCVKCGEQIKAGALFCPHCGAKQQIEEDVVSEMIPQEEMTDPRNDEKAVIHEQSIIKEIGEPQEGNEAHVIQDENIPISESPKDDLANTLEPYKSGQSSKKWLWILGVILLFGIIGGGWFFLNDNQAPEVGTLTAYYAKEDFNANEHEYKKGELICDSNDPLNHVSDEDENNYRYSGDEGGEEYSWLLPKSKVEKKVYTMNQLTPSVIDRQAFFEAENGCVAKIFWSNINGHRFYNWNGKEEKYNEEERYKECFVLSAELLSPWDNSKYLFEEQLNEKSGNIELYCENKYRQLDHPIGFIEESWCNREGYDFKKSAYDKDGKLLVDQWEIDGIPDYISIAYIADEDALYINGILYYLREESSEEHNVEETPDVSKGFYVEVNYGYYFYTPRFLREGEQQGELTKDNNVFYESKGYSLNISVDESDIESQFWMYNTMRSRAGDEPYEESMKTKEEDYLKVDDNSGSILLIMQSKGSKMCGTMYFTYPEGGKAIVDEAIEKSIQKTRENDV